MTQLRMQLYVGKVNELGVTKIAKDLHERGFTFRSGRKLVKDNGEVNNTLLNYKNNPLYLYIYPESKQVTTAWREVTTELYETETYGYGIWKNDDAKGFFADLKVRLDELEAAKNPEIEYVTQEEANNGRWLERLELKDGDTVKCVKVSSTSGTFTLGKKYKVFKSPTNEKQLRIEVDSGITFDIDSFFSRFIKCENVELAEPKEELVPFTPIEAQIQNNLEKIKVYDELIFNMQTKHERLEEHIRELRKKRRVLGEDNKVLERYK